MAEKEDALWRYNMERKLTIALRFFGFLLVLTVLSWPLFPALIPDAVEAAGDFRRRFVSAFNKPLFTFVVVNIIIAAVYVLSSPRKTHRQSTGSDIYNEYVIFSRSTPAAATTVSSSPVMVENAVAVSQVKLQRKLVDTETKISVPTVKQQQPKNIRTVAKTKPEVSPKQYRRTRSMVSGHRQERPRDREFRRSETGVRGRELAVSVIETPCKLMEEMSSEEFRLIVESFIAERKKSLMQENTAQGKRMYCS